MKESFEQIRNDDRQIVLERKVYPDFELLRQKNWPKNRYDIIKINNDGTRKVYAEKDYERQFGKLSFMTFKN